MTNNDRVLFSFILKNESEHSLIVSREKAEEAIETWKNLELVNIYLEIKGVVDHRDNNEIKFVAALEDIILMYVCEIKSLWYSYCELEVIGRNNGSSVMGLTTSDR